jgi:hypothetical protein
VPAAPHVDHADWSAVSLLEGHERRRLLLIWI